jgi:hypothetical protein
VKGMAGSDGRHTGCTPRAGAIPAAVKYPIMWRGTAFVPLVKFYAARSAELPKPPSQQTPIILQVAGGHLAESVQLFDFPGTTLRLSLQKRLHQRMEVQAGVRS